MGGKWSGCRRKEKEEKTSNLLVVRIAFVQACGSTLEGTGLSKSSDGIDSGL